MSAELGHLALILAFVMAMAQSAALFWGAARNEAALMATGRTAAVLQFAFIAAAFIALAWGYARLDFSMALVAAHSNTTQPLGYRLAATWGSHEGSMLLWNLILALNGMLLAVFGGALRRVFQARVLAVQGLLGAAFLGFSLFTSNPFARLWPAPPEGAELNPLLQDPGLITHPPLLYLGYVGFSTAFAFAVAALIEGRVDAAWARWVRPWVLMAWTALTAGIALGSHWAYYELGWGGWWFWDPVENASLMPWLLGCALLHSALVLEKRGALISWTLLLAILTFSLSLIGAFLVRSGVLTSVHAFAVDPGRGAYILAFAVLATGGALALYAWRAPLFRTGAIFSPVSKEAGITLNNLFLCTATATVFLGTFYPVLADLVSGQAISVGPPYYAVTFTPLGVMLALLVGFGPTLRWKRDDMRDVIVRLRGPLLLGGAALALGFMLFGWRHVAATAGLGLGVWLIAASVVVPLRRWKGEGGPRARSLWRQVRATPPAVWATALAHAGVGVMVIGMVATTAFEQSRALRMAPEDQTVFAGRTLTLEALAPAIGPNYRADQARFVVATPGRSRELIAERRFYPASGTQTTEAGIISGLTGNLYVSVGERDEQGRALVRMWSHPFVGWIWGGAMLMAAGGLASLSDRRLRLGAPGDKVKTKPKGAAA